MLPKNRALRFDLNKRLLSLENDIFRIFNKKQNNGTNHRVLKIFSVTDYPFSLNNDTNGHTKSQIKLKGKLPGNAQ